MEYGADPTARMVGGWTPAHCAAETGRLNVLKVLIDQQSPVVIPDNSGDTPKRVAEIYGHTACIELLERYQILKGNKVLIIISYYIAWSSFFYLIALFSSLCCSVEDSLVQRQQLIRDKFRSNTRKISKIVAEKGLESLKDKVVDATR